MSNIIEMRDTENKDEWVNWIEEAINKEYFKFYEYKHFSNIEKIGSGGFGEVFRANWKNSEQYLALKSFFNLDNITVKEIVREVITKYCTIYSNIVNVVHFSKFIIFVFCYYHIYLIYIIRLNFNVK
jgi:hypothetical protein